MSRPEVSIVLCAHNAEDIIADTLESVLSQEGPSFELIVIDDGSKDRTAAVIHTVVTGRGNVTVLSNESNLGLTKSLVIGCERASGEYMARIDAGDRYLPGRLARQLEVMERNPSIGLVSCGTRFTSAEGEFLYQISQQPTELANGLALCEVGKVRGPSHHGSTMFRRTVYTAVGGYRDVFRVAQDLDLWMRIYEHSQLLAMPEILYDARLYPNSISVGRRALQLETTRLILEGASCRRAGLPEPDYRASIPEFRSGRAGSHRQNLSRYHYFLGGCLAERDYKSASSHFALAWRCSPLNLKYGTRYLRSLIA